MTDTVFDPGLQPERTLLAWRRTCLAFGVASAAAIRFTLAALGPAAFIVGLFGVGLAGIAYGLVWQRYRRAHAALTRTQRLEHGAVPMLLATGCAGLLGLACATYVVTRAMGVQ